MTDIAKLTGVSQSTVSLVLNNATGAKFSESTRNKVLKAAHDLGGQLPRRIHYYPATGKVVRRLLGTSESSAVAREETEYVSRLSSRKAGGEIELFNE